MNYSDIFFKKTQRHFEDLLRRYGSPIIAANLTKRKEDVKQEVLLNENYEKAIDFINFKLPEPFKIIYTHYDLKSERRDGKFYLKIYEKAKSLIEKTNMFTFVPISRQNKVYNLTLQQGVIRSNCVDCLDRTNVFQQVIGMAVLCLQVNFSYSYKQWG